MGDASIRAAIYSYFSAPAIQGVQAWYRDEPWFLAGQAWKLIQNGGAGAVAYIHLDTSEESRITVGGTIGLAPAGTKIVHHTVSIVLQYQYLIKTLQPGLVEDDWVRPLDAIIDLCKARIRADPAFGTGVGGAIYQAGQGYQGSTDIRQTRDLPVQPPGGGKVFSWNRLEFDLLEIITA